VNFYFWPLDVLSALWSWLCGLESTDGQEQIKQPAVPDQNPEILPPIKSDELIAKRRKAEREFWESM